MEARIEQLFSDLVDDRLDDDGAQELSRLLRGDEAAVEKFRELLRMHFLLAEQAGPVRAFTLAELRAARAIDDEFDRRAEAARSTATPAALTSAPSSDDWRKSARLPWALLAIAASVLVVTAMWRQPSSGDGASRVATSPSVGDQAASPQIAKDGAPSANSRIVARVLRKIDCDWAEDRWSATANGEVQKGQVITLTKGLLVLEFASGAEITVNGPATLVTTSGSTLKMIRGELSASVPPRARGFCVETHAGKFIDLGTEFGLLVDENGEVETHVFKGEVVAQVDGLPEGDHSTLLNAGEAWARNTAGPIETGLPAEPRRFLRPLKSEETEVSETPPVLQGLTLHFAADAGVQRDVDDRVSEWGDLSGSHGDLRSENAWQVDAEQRPLWLPRAIGKRPALRFDGYRSLVTEPVYLPTSHTEVVVFRADGDVARQMISERANFRELGVQLFNFYGPPHTVLQISEDRSLVGRVHLGFIPQHVDPVDVGYVKSPTAIDNRPHVAAYCYDADSHRASLYLDGGLVGASDDVPVLDATMAARYIGSHFERRGFGFTGEIAEMLVYQGALSAAQISETCHWLVEKYELVQGVPIEVTVLNDREVGE